MAKTHHRRRHRRANRSRRGGMMKASSSGASAAAALALAPAAASPRARPPPVTDEDLQAIFKRVNAIAAKATPPKKTISKNPTKTSAQTHFEKVLAGKAKHSTSKSPFKYNSGTRDRYAAYQRGF